MTLEEILAQVQKGTLSPDVAESLIRQEGYKEKGPYRICRGDLLQQ